MEVLSRLPSSTLVNTARLYVLCDYSLSGSSSMGVLTDVSWCVGAGAGSVLLQRSRRGASETTQDNHTNGSAMCQLSYKISSLS